MDFEVKVMNKNTQAKYFAHLMPTDIYDQLTCEDVFLVGALGESGPIGAAVVQLRGELGELEWLCADEDHRHEQVGTKLLLECVRVLRQLECEGLYAVCRPEEQAVSALLEGFGMEREVEDAWELTLDQVRAKLHEGKRLHTLALEDVPAFQFTDYIRRVFPAADGAVSRSDFHPRMSRLIVTNSAVSGAILIEEVEGSFSVGWLHASGPDQRAALVLLQDAVTVASGLVGGETKICFMTQNEAVKRLAEKLAGEAAERWSEERWSLEDARFRLKGLDQFDLDEELAKLDELAKSEEQEV